MSERKKIVIDRAKWRFGGDSLERQAKYGYTSLLNCSGLQCCLGFTAEQLGVSREKLDGKRIPEEIGTVIPFLVRRREMYDDIYFHDTTLSMQAIHINDNPELTKPARESALIKLFAENGLDLEFIGEYPEGA